jgi:hypothetical protein
MSKPKWLDKKETPRKFSQRREKLIGKRMGALPTPNSGARWHSKGDLSNVTQLIEVKSTEQGSMVVHAEWLNKIRQEAIKIGKDPIIVLDFGNIKVIGSIEK